MIIHIDKDNPKPIEQKVQELVLSKLFIKVDDSKIFIDKEDFIGLILQDVIAIAKAGYDIEKALKIALKEQPRYKDMPDVKRNELVEAMDEFGDEIDAYNRYIEMKKEGEDELKIYDEVRFILNSDEEFLFKKLHEVIMQAFDPRLSEADAAAFGADRLAMIDNFANQVKLIAKNETIEDAVEEAYSEFENYAHRDKVKKEGIKKEFERFAPLAENEIKAYKFALNLYSQGADVAMILATVKQLLQLS